MPLRLACIPLALTLCQSAWADAPNLKAQEPQATPPADGTLRYEVDTGHSAILFKVKRNGVSNFFGRFNKFSGTIDLLERGPRASGRVALSIAVDSIDTGSGARDTNLKKASELFAISDFPEAHFDSSQVRKLGKDRFAVQGTLTFRGVAQPVQFEARRLGVTKDDRGGGAAGFEATIHFSRSKFGMTGMAQSISDDVEVIVSLACALKSSVPPL